MDKKKEKTVNEALKHGDEATELLEQSNAIHQMEMQGLIDESSATEALIDLNRQAIDEMEKAIERQKEFLSEQEKS